MRLSAICINAGGPDTFLSDGVSTDCFADEFFSGGTVFTDATMPLPTLRYGNFTYSIPTSQGMQTVTIDFVEPNKTAIGQRAFTVTINGIAARAYVQTIASDGTGSYDPGSESFDLFQLAGLKTTYTVRYLVPSAGTVRIVFTTQIWNALVSRIRVESALPIDVLATGATDVILVRMEASTRRSRPNLPWPQVHIQSSSSGNLNQFVDRFSPLTDPSCGWSPSHDYQHRSTPFLRGLRCSRQARGNIHTTSRCTPKDSKDGPERN